MTTCHSKLEWREIPGYEGLYEVSNNGLVRSLRRGKIMSTNNESSTRYAKVSLYKEGKEKQVTVHRLVLLAFKGEPPEGKTSINHINGNKRNNDVNNLEWSNAKENGLHAYATGLNGGRGTKVTLTHEETQATFSFSSMKKASIFMGKHGGYLADVKRRGTAPNEKEWSVAFV
jgi:hypothetical protein